jgi:hypothetical protein
MKSQEKDQIFSLGKFKLSIECSVRKKTKYFLWENLSSA